MRYIETYKKNPIDRAKRITSKFGPTDLLPISAPQSTKVETFLPKRYSAVVSDDEMEKINNKILSLNFIYMGKRETSQPYLLQIQM